jgi:hypothetical protein
MTKQKAIELLGTLFETSKSNTGENGTIREWTHFRTEVMQKDNEAYPIYQAVSNVAFKSELTHGFSYEITTRACDILAEAEDWDNEDDIQERIDSAVPIYNSELMEIYLANWWAVDEARTDMGAQGDSVKDAQAAWYYLIEMFVTAIKYELGSVITETV